MKGFSLTAKQRAANVLLGGPQRNTLIVGGSRSGKTFLLVRAVAIRAMRAPRSRHAILRYRHNAVRESIWLDTLPKVIRLCFPGVPCESRERDGYVRLPNDSEIWIAGLDDKERVERVLGKEYATMYFNECSQISWPSVTTALTRLAQKVEGLANRAYFDLNPTGTGHWTYQMFIEKKSPASLEALADPEQYEHFYLNPADNAINIDPAYLDALRQLPERQRRRFFEGVYVAALDGALWTLELIEQWRVSEAPALKRIVVAVDPSGASSEFDMRADEIGIVVMGIGADGHGYVLEDLTGRYSPEHWGRVACEAFHRWNADRILYERNFGGDMCRAVIQGADRNVSTKEVTASRGKTVRAEPVAALYERGKIHHVGRYPAMEDELTNFTTAGYLGDRSPNRADAMVWAATELIVEQQPHGLLAHYQKEAENMKTQKIVVSTFGKPANGPDTPKCPTCGSTAIVAVGTAFVGDTLIERKRCGQCGNQWG